MLPPGAGTLLQVPEQPDRAGSPPDKTAGRSRCSGSSAPETAAVTIRGIPAGGENQETTIQPQTPHRKSHRRPRNLGRGPGGLKSAKPLVRQKHTLKKICTRTNRSRGLRTARRGAIMGLRLGEPPCRGSAFWKESTPGRPPLAGALHQELAEQSLRR